MAIGKVILDRINRCNQKTFPKMEFYLEYK